MRVQKRTRLKNKRPADANPVLEVDTFDLGLECEARHGGTPPSEKFIPLDNDGALL